VSRLFVRRAHFGRIAEENRIFSSASTSPRSRTLARRTSTGPTPHGDEGVGFSNQHLSQHSAGAFACKFSQWIVDGIRLAEDNDSAIYRHGVSLLSGRFWQSLDTRLDTPPSINRRHPDSALARYRAGLAHAAKLAGDD
jgi:hypothetical protein